MVSDKKYKQETELNDLRNNLKARTIVDLIIPSFKPKMLTDTIISLLLSILVISIVNILKSKKLQGIIINLRYNLADIPALNTMIILIIAIIRSDTYTESSIRHMTIVITAKNTFSKGWTLVKLLV